MNLVWHSARLLVVIQHHMNHDAHFWQPPHVHAYPSTKETYLHSPKHIGTILPHLRAAPGDPLEARLMWPAAGSLARRRWAKRPRHVGPIGPGTESSARHPQREELGSHGRGVGGRVWEGLRFIALLVSWSRLSVMAMGAVDGLDAPSASRFLRWLRNSLARGSTCLPPPLPLTITAEVEGFRRGQLRLHGRSRSRAGEERTTSSMGMADKCTLGTLPPQAAANWTRGRSHGDRNIAGRSHGLAQHGHDVGP